MAGNPFDRVIFNALERPSSTDWNQVQAQQDRALRMVIRSILAKRASLSAAYGAASFPSGCLGDGFQVLAAGGMNLSVSAGLGFIYDAAGNTTNIGSIASLDDMESYKPLPLNSAVTIPAPSADPTNPRWDIIEVKYDRRTTDSMSRDILQISPRRFVSTLVDKTLSWLLGSPTSYTINGSGSINYKTGTPAGSPTKPSTSTGYMKIAEIYVGAAVGSIAQSKIIDTRNVLSPNGLLNVGVSWTQNSGAASAPGAVTIIAPPGVQAGVVGLGGSNMESRLYIVAGGGITGGVVNVSGIAPLLNADPGLQQIADVLHPLVAVATAGESTEVGGATASPTLAMMEGQMRFCVHTAMATPGGASAAQFQANALLF